MKNNDNTTRNESALVCAARDGDTQAVQQLMQDNWRWLKGLSYNILQDINEVDDVLQNICLIVLEKIHTLRQPERFKGWLATVARHAALAHRQKISQKPLSLNDLLADQQQSTDNNPAKNLAQKEDHGYLLEAMKELPEKYREVFILKYLKEMSYAQIAEVMDLSITTVQIRLVRARRMIYNKLKGIPTDKVPRT